MTPHTRLRRLLSIDRLAEQLVVSSRRPAGGSRGASCMSVVSAAGSLSRRKVALPTPCCIAGDCRQENVNVQLHQHSIRDELLLYVGIDILF